MNFLLEYISNSDIFTDLPKVIQKKIQILIQEETILKLLRELLQQNVDIKQAIKIILESETNQEIKDYMKRYNYVKRNKSLYVENINDEYGVYRDTFDCVMKKRGRVTRKKLIELTEMLIYYKIIKGKEKSKYIQILETWQKEKKLSKANKNKLMKPLGMIYTITKLKDGIQINSLNTKI